MSSLGFFAAQSNFADGGGSDPSYANNVLQLAGDSATDLSSYAHIAIIGADVTFDSSPSSSNGGVGSTSIRTNGGAAASWLYASAPEWRFNPVYTLDFWIYFDAKATNWIPLAATDFSRFVQFSGGGGTDSNLNLQGKWGGYSGPQFPVSTWHYVRMVSDGVDAGFYLNGGLVSNQSVIAADGVDKAFELLDNTANNPNYRFMQVRYKQGIALNDPTDLTIPVQSAPWPDH